MSDETSRLVVSVHGEGINETASQLAGLQSQARATEISIQQLQNAFRQSVSGGILDANFLQSSQSAMEKLIATSTREGQAILGITTATKENTQINQQSGESFGSLALKIAGYSSALNLGISVVRNAISGMVDLGKQAVELAGQFERSRVAWGVFLKDVDAGSQMFDKLYDLAQRTPLSFQGVESAAQMLKGFGLQTEEIIPTLERMGDVARGNDETMQRLALAYGQALAQGRVLTRDLYQFVNAGVPIFDALAEVMGKSVQQVQQLVTDGKVGFPEIEAALKSLTGQGGQFEGMMEKASQTYEGKLSIAKDNWKAMLAEMGNDLQDSLKNWLDKFNKFAEDVLINQNVAKVLSGNGGNVESAIAYVKSQNQNDQISGTLWRTAGNLRAETTYATVLEILEAELKNRQMESDEASRRTGAKASNYPGYNKRVLPTTFAPVWVDGEIGIFDGKEYRGDLKNQRWIPVEEEKKDKERTQWQNTLAEATGISTGELPINQRTGDQYIIAWFKKNFAAQIDATPTNDSESEAWIRDKFTDQVKEIKNKLFEAGFSSADRSVKALDSLLSTYGTPKKATKVKDTTLDDMVAYYKNLPGAKGESGIAPPGDWSNVPSIAEQFLEDSPAAKAARLALLETPTAEGPFSKQGYTNAFNDYIRELTGPHFGERATAPEGYEPRSDFVEQANAPMTPAQQFYETYGFSLEDWPAEQEAKYKKTRASEIALYGTSQSDTNRWNALNALFGGVQEPSAEIVPQDEWIDRAVAKVMEMGTPSPEAAAMGQERVSGYWDIALQNLQTEFTTPQYPKTYNAGGTTGKVPYGEGTPLWAQMEAIAEAMFKEKYGMSFNEYASQNAQTFGEYRASPYFEYDNTTKRWNALNDWMIGQGASTQATELYLPELLEANRKAMEGPATADKNIRPWMQQTPESVNPETGDIYGYYSDSTLPSGKIPQQIAVTDVEKYAEAQDALNQRLDEGTISFEGYQQEMQKLREQYDPATKAAKSFEATMKSAGESLLNTGISALSDELYDLGEALANGSASWDSFGDSMGDALETILKMIPKLAIQVGLQLISSGQYAAGIALVGAGLIGQVSAGALEGNALGGVYDSPSLSHYANGVYDKPHLFTYANGGVFGEAGPEAIMPLSRDSSGRLGVSGGSSAKVDIQIINQSSTPVSKKTTTITDAAGNKKIMVWIKDVVKQEVATANAGGVKKS